MLNSQMVIELLSFEKLRKPSEFTVHAKIARKGGVLSLEFEIKGLLSEVRGTPGGPTLGELDDLRKDELWKTTCFEAFIGAGGSAEYWELNFSLSGEWNLYHFDQYRVGMKREEKVGHLKPVILQKDSQLWRIGIELNLNDLFNRSVPETLELGLSAILERKDHSKTHWALQHPQEKPDFHWRGSFKQKI